ncbi:MAG: 4-demethylwyosine synthase TYW1 [Candidatus Aenigmatarchaeota archaeon]
MEKLTIDQATRKKLINANYGIFGHSTVHICNWTKRALRDQGNCYKNKFYGIETLRCMEFSPAGVFCHNRCIYCWRPTEFYRLFEMEREKVDEPEQIIQALMKERKKLLTGFGSNKKVKKDKLKEAYEPTHFAISLSGEATMYPKLPEMIKYLKSLPQTKSIFLVTNGQEPKMLERLEREEVLPTQIYLSMNAGNKKTFLKINCPLLKDAWERFSQSLKFLNNTKARSVIRITLIKGINDSEKEISDFASLVREANPNFVEVKSYMHVGSSIARLSASHMLEQEEIKSWSEKLLKFLPEFEYMDEQEESRIVVIQNKKRFVDRWIIEKK